MLGGGETGEIVDGVVEVCVSVSGDDENGWGGEFGKRERREEMGRTWEVYLEDHL